MRLDLSVGMNQLHLRNQVFRSSKSSVVPRTDLTQRPAEYKSWSKDSLDMACQEVKEGKLSIRRAAESYQIPKSTLSDHVSGRVREGSHSGPSRYLTDEEEAELVYFLVGSANVGYAKTKKDVLAICEPCSRVKRTYQLSC